MASCSLLAPGDPLASAASEICVCFSSDSRQTGIFHQMVISGWFRAVFTHRNGAAACVTGVSGHRKASCLGPDVSDI